jgi:adenosylcobyric acid synthase
LEGYEIHMGRTSTARPWLEIARNGEADLVADGAASADGCVWGCYLHGLFANGAFRRTWLASLGPGQGPAEEDSALLEGALERLADAVEETLDIKQLEMILGEG